MGIEVTWAGDDQTVLYVICDGDWNWHEFYTASSEASKWIGSVGHVVDIVLDMRNSKPLPSDFMGHVQRTRVFHLSGGTTVIVQPIAARLFPSSMFRDVSKSHNNDRLLIASSLKEANAILASRRGIREERLV